jgi:hypothetical protein
LSVQQEEYRQEEYGPVEPERSFGTGQTISEGKQSSLLEDLHQVEGILHFSCIFPSTQTRGGAPSFKIPRAQRFATVSDECQSQNATSLHIDRNILKVKGGVSFAKSKRTNPFIKKDNQS